MSEKGSDPERTETSNSLKTQTQHIMNKLHDLNEVRFERAFVDSEIAYLQVVINFAEMGMIPNAQGAELKVAP